MNTIGIDYQQTVTVVCLGEGSGGAARVRNVGDGLRPLIPNAVYGESLWGSRALEAGGKIAEVEDGPWLADPDSSRFWLRLYERLYAFLGRIPPTSQRGYRVVAGLQAADWRGAIEGVERLCGQAGFGAPTCISSADALLARHLAEQRQLPAGDSTVTVVASGDTATAVCSYRVRREGSGTVRTVPRLLARDSTPRSLPYGQAHWAGRLLVHVSDLFTEPIRSGYELAMRDSALEFGSRLRRAAAGRAVSWTGPLRDKLYAPLELTAADCSAWPEVAPFLQQLPGLIRDSAASMGSSGRPDLILVGGIGALWPFAATAAGTVGLVQQSGNPEEDVARGTAWWPEAEALWADLSPMATQALFNAPLPDWMSDEPAGISTDSAAAVSDSFFQHVDEMPSFFSSEAGVSFAPTDTSPFPQGEAEIAVAGASVFTAFQSEPLVTEERINPFDVLAETKDADITASRQEKPISHYDLPVPPAHESSEEDVDLDDLPPWDPRRNEL